MKNVYNENARAPKNPVRNSILSPKAKQIHPYIINLFSIVIKTSTQMCNSMKRRVNTVFVDLEDIWQIFLDFHETSPKGISVI